MSVFFGMGVIVQGVFVRGVFVIEPYLQFMGG